MTAWLTIKKLIQFRITLISDTLVIIFVIIVSVFYFGGIKAVPFHPDESTQIFMSSDFNDLFNAPRSLFWLQQDNTDLRQHYRELDAPLTRYVIGLGRWVTSTPALKSDWNWSQSWDLNILNGAMPSEMQLLVSRYSIAAIFPLTLFLVYLSGLKLQGRMTGVVALLLFSSNALILLHTRRAMAESLLVFFIVLSIFLLFTIRTKLWLVAIPIALAVNSKQTALFLIVSGLSAIVWFGIKSRIKTSKLLLNLFLFLIILGSISFLLNPFIWAHPLSAIKNAFQARIELTNSQINSLGSASPSSILDSPGKKIAGLLGNLFFQKSAIQDIGNYTENLAITANAYLINPFHTILRSIAGGAILILLSISGFIFGLYRIIKKNDRSGNLVLLVVLSIFSLVIHLISIKLPFQRYVILLVPIYILWISYLVSSFAGFVIEIIRKTPAPAGTGVEE